MVAPHFVALASKYKTKGVFVKVDVDNAKDVAQKYQVRSMPTFMFFHKGIKVEEFSGAQVSKLTETVERLIKSCSRKTFPSRTLGWWQYDVISQPSVEPDSHWAPPDLAHHQQPQLQKLLVLVDERILGQIQMLVHNSEPLLPFLPNPDNICSLCHRI